MDMMSAINDTKKAYISAMDKQNSATERFNKTLDKTIKKLNQIKSLMGNNKMVLSADFSAVEDATKQVKKAGEEVENLKWAVIESYVKIQTSFLQIGYEVEQIGWKALDVCTKIQYGVKLFDGRQIVMNLRDNTVAGLNKIWSGIQKINSKRIEIKANIKDNILQKMDNVILKAKDLKSNFKEKVRLAFDIKNSVIPKLKSVAKAMSPLRQTVNIVIKAKDKTKKILGSVGGKLKEFAKGGLAKLASAGLEKAIDIAGASLNNAISRQSKQNSIESIMSQNNSGMSEKDVKAKSDSYMQSLKANSNSSIYSESEVLDAGSSALKMAKGDTGEAKKFLSLAEDMAASNSGKSLAEAMAALTEAQEGNLDALKEFGVNATEESLKSAGGNILNMKNDSGSTMTEQFKGGAEEAGKTIPGQIAKLKGIGETILTDIASTSLGGISDILGKGVEFLSANQEKFTQFGLTISKVVGNAFNFIFSIIQAVKPVLDTFMNFIFSKKDVFLEMFGSIMNVVDQFKVAWAETWPVIQEMLAGVWEIIEPILSVWIDYIASFMGVLSELAIIAIDVFVDTILPVIQKVFGIVKPIVESVMGFILDFYSGIAGLYDLIADFLRNILKEEVADKTQAKENRDQSGKTKKVNNHATGIGYVPYNNYPALLHQGERVLTAAENGQLSRGVSSGQITINIPKLADHISASDSRDVDTLLSRLEDKLMAVAVNMGAV